MTVENGRKKIFISYEWSEQEWVKELAEMIVRDYGIEVKLDIWDLRPGNDAYLFMESMATDEMIDNVLIICSPGYKIKADKRTGGVGVETQILSNEIYEKVEQTKIVAVIPESGSKNSLPTYLRNRIYFDFSIPGNSYAKELEKLCRHIYGKPKEVMPPLGEIIDFEKRDQEGINDLRMKQIIRQIENNVDTNGRKAINLFLEFNVEYFKVLRQIYLDIDDNEEFPDEVSIKNIEKTNILQEYLLKVVKELAISDLFNCDLIIEFIENHFKEVNDLKMSQPYKDYYVDHILFMMHKGFLVICTNLFKYEKFELIASITKATFYDRFQLRYVNFGKIRMPQYRLKNRAERLGVNERVLYTGLLRANLDDDLFQTFTITDLLLYYISEINPNLETVHWFPITCIHIEEYNVAFFRKFQSRRHYEKVKCLFGMDLDEFKKLLITKDIGGGYLNIPRFVDYIDRAECLGSER